VQFIVVHLETAEYPNPMDTYGVYMP